MIDLFGHILNARSLGTALAVGGGMLAGKMMGGGGGGGSSGGSVQQVETLMPEQKNLLKKIIQQVLPQIGKPGEVYPGQMYPGISPIQQQSFGMAGNVLGPSGSAMDMLSQAGRFDPADINAAMAPVGDFARSIFGDLSKDIAGRYGAIDSAQSSALPQALAKEARNVSLGLGAQFAPMQFGAQQAAQNRLIPAAGAMAQNVGQLQNIGAVQRGISGEQLQEPYAKYQMAQAQPRQIQQYLGPALMTPGFGNIGFEGVRQPSILESLLPALGSAFGGYLGGPGFAGQ